MSGERIESGVLTGYAKQIMLASGVDDAQSQSLTDHLIWSELVGRSNYGLIRLPIHIQRVTQGLLKSPCEPSFQKLSDTMELLDGDEGFGHHIGKLGMQRAVELARHQGVGIVGVCNSNFFGAGAYYIQLAAEAGMVGLAMSNSFPKVAAFGGIRAVLGTNPFAFGVPRRNGESFLLDMATSGLAGSTVRAHIDQNEPLPEGLAVDGDGAPITDPKQVSEGALLPFGGAKGYGMALLVEILAGVMTGAGILHGVSSMYHSVSESGHNGHFLMALDISKWMPIETYFDRFEELVEGVKLSNTGHKVLLPGETRWQCYKDNLQNGILLDDHVRRSLQELSQPHGIQAPWKIK